MYTDHQGTDDQCALISVAPEVPPVSAQCPSVHINATYQCPCELTFNVTYQCHPISATYQCHLSVPPISATYQCHLSVPPISATYQCHLSVPMSPTS
ncbi:unnamed protein product, partial [Staurois parvus]